MRASIRAEYHIKDIRTESVLHLADLVAWLPAGCALWQSTGGPRALSEGDDLLRWIDYRLRVLAWQQSKDGTDGRKQPDRPKPIPFTGEKAVEEAHARRQAAARAKRQPRG